MKDVLISIVNHQHVNLLPRCLDCVRQNAEGLSVQVTVLDNASTDASADMMRRRYAEVDLIAQAFRDGFGANQNTIIGPRLADVRYVLLLNDDAYLEDGALRAMVAFMDANPQVGIVGPRLVYPGGEPQSSYAAFPTVWDEVFYLWGFGRLVPKRVRKKLAGVLSPLSRVLPKMGRVYLENWFSIPDRPLEVDWLCGACLLARADMIHTVGLLDSTSFFMYFEDVDWCRRASDGGWRVVFLPAVVVSHHQQASRSPVTARAWVRSALRYFAKHGTRTDVAVLRLNIMAKAVLLLTASALAWVWPGLRATAATSMALQRDLWTICRREVAS